MTIDPIRSRTYTFQMLYLYLLIKFAKASIENYSSAGHVLNLLLDLFLFSDHKTSVQHRTLRVGMRNNVKRYSRSTEQVELNQQHSGASETRWKLS